MKHFLHVCMACAVAAAAGACANETTSSTLEPKKIRVELNDEAKDLLVEHGYDPKLGARPMRRIVQKTVENIVAKAVLGGDLGDGGTIQIDAKMIEESLE